MICVALMTSEFLPTQVIANATLNLSEVKVDEELANNEKLENTLKIDEQYSYFGGIIDESIL